MASDFTKIPYLDLRLEARKQKLHPVIGRQEELQRLLRVVGKTIKNSAVIVAKPGTGRTAFLRAFALQASQQSFFNSFTLVELDSNSLQKASTLPHTQLDRYHEAFASIEKSIVVIDNFGQLLINSQSAAQNWSSICKLTLQRSSARLVLSVEPKEFEFLQKEWPWLHSFCEVIKLEPLSSESTITILQNIATIFEKKSLVNIPQETVALIVQSIQKFPSLGELPKAGITMLDECVAEIKAHPSKQARPTVGNEVVEKIVSEKTGIPTSRLGHNEKEKLKNLHKVLCSGVIGQEIPLKHISTNIQRAKLGLKNSKRPLGSFLLLGPSGVGKTETAKILAQELYGSEQSFLRIDMSEFGEPHTVQRLVGSPPGYVGSSEGGQLTNHLKNYPYSLVLLDEIEKAHPKIFDIFLQLLDDGRLTSGTGELISGTNATFIATSNLAVDRIIEHFLKGTDIHHPQFLTHYITPVLTQYFRMEFLNRFDALLVYKPLTPDDLTDIALLEIQKIQSRMKEHRVQFTVSRELLAKNIAPLADPRFGARPVKRYIEDLCEGLIAKQLLQEE